VAYGELLGEALERAMLFQFGIDSSSLGRADLIPVVERENPSKVVGVVTSEGVAYAYEKAKALR
jgi:hypothetical protein